ncbi:MAG: metalloregulator ArsR/SmtB family transcription factor [Patescibacteria group bacterium]|jgi:DNA-binding transcriptional ArsR family regulator
MLNQKAILKNRKVFSKIDKNMAAAFKVLSDVNRYRIFRLLVEQPELTVGDIAHILKISLPLASQHIKILEHANLLQKERAGKKIFPKLKHGNPFVQAVITTIKQTQ